MSGVPRCIGDIDEEEEDLSSSDWMAKMTAEMS